MPGQIHCPNPGEYANSGTEMISLSSAEGGEEGAGTLAVLKSGSESPSCRLATDPDATLRHDMFTDELCSEHTSAEQIS